MGLDGRSSIEALRVSGPRQARSLESTAEVKERALLLMEKCAAAKNCALAAVAVYLHATGGWRWVAPVASPESGRAARHEGRHGQGRDVGRGTIRALRAAPIGSAACAPPAARSGPGAPAVSTSGVAVRSERSGARWRCSQGEGPATSQVPGAEERYRLPYVVRGVRARRTARHPRTNHAIGTRTDG